MIYSYNKGQQDTLFLNFILRKNSTCFGQIYCPSSGVLSLYLQKYVFCHTGYVDCQLVRSGPRQQTGNITSMPNINCCECSIKTLMMDSKSV